MRFFAGLFSVCAVTFTAGTLWAGGSGFNVVVVVNQNSTNSVQLGNYYCEKRGVPPQNLLRASWSGGNINWQESDFQSVILNPLLAMLSARQLTNQVDYVLLSMGFPYRVTDTTNANSTTTPLFYGFIPDDPAPESDVPASCSLPNASFSSYAGSESLFRSVAPGTSQTNFLAVMLTCSNLAQAKLVIDRGLASDSTFFTQTVYLAKSTDIFRNIRFVLFDNAIFNTRLRGNYSMQRTNVNSPNSLGYIGGYQNGYQNGVPAANYVPGALADQLTSFGGQLYEQTDHTTALQYLNAGAAGSYGTVTEPCGYLAKFPAAQVFFYQSRGFSMAECYYQSVTNPYQGLLMGEPLAAPFALPATADWSSLTNGTVLSGQAVLNPTFSAAATNLPLGQVDLFVDGIFMQTMTNLPPTTSNILSVTLNGSTVNYTVPTNATVASVATDLAAALNAQTNSTRVQAWPVGDRLELQALDVTVPGSNVTLTASAAGGSAAQLTTLLTPARSTFLDTIAAGYLGVLASNTPAAGDWLQFDFTKTNGAHVTVSVTNTTAGTTISTLAQNLVNLVNATTALQSADGVLASDFFDYTPYGIVAAQFTLYARSPGSLASQIQATFTASTNLLALPSGTNQLQDNLNDLRPRNHLYVSSGAVSLPVNFVLDTTRFPDGFHQLTAVAYEGTSVRTQTRVSRTVRIQNTALSATFTPLLTGTNATLDTPLQFTVAANATNISRIEMFSTGNSGGVVSNQASATFTAPSATLGLGLHPFYALVADTAGNRFRTQTVWIRLIPPFKLSIGGTPLTLSWPAATGVGYSILATTNLASSFQTVTSFVATNAVVQWPIPAPTAAASFYRVGLSP